MSKHFSLFSTESQYQAAKDNLDYPNVSLIDTTGDLHYAKYIGQEVVNAPFGSILMADVATNKLFYIEDSANYNLTDYPFADYKPIAVCIYDKTSNANNQAVFMAFLWANYSALGTPRASVTPMAYGFNGIDLSSKVSDIRDQETKHISSTYINNAMKSLVTVDYSGASIPNNAGNGESPAFCSCWRFKTVGTNEGNWYLPSFYDISKYKNNYTTINNVITVVKNIAGSSYINKVNDYLATASEGNGNIYVVCLDNYGSAILGRKNNNYGVRPVFIPHVEEL